MYFIRLKKYSDKKRLILRYIKHLKYIKCIM